MAANPSANTAIGGEQIDDTQHLSEQSSGYQTMTFKRTVQHYITNNNASTTPTATVIGSEGILQSGWHWIPFSAIVSAAGPSDIDVVLLHSKYRIKEQGFKIIKLNAMQQTVVTGSSATQINNSFVQAPCALLYKDDRAELWQNTFLATSPAAISTTPICLEPTNYAPSQAGSAPLPNSTMSQNFSTYSASYNTTSGTLPNVQIQGSVAAGSGLVPNSFDLMNGGNVTMLQSGQEHEYTWHNPDRLNWYSCSTSTTATGIPPTGSDLSVGTVMIGNTYANSAVLATGVYHNRNNVPMMHLIRVPPLFNDLGPINISQELWIEYHVTFEVVMGRFWYGRSGTPGSFGIASVIAANVMPWPTNKRSILGELGQAIVTETMSRDGKYKKRVMEDNDGKPITVEYVKL